MLQCTQSITLYALECGISYRSFNDWYSRVKDHFNHIYMPAFKMCMESVHLLPAGNTVIFIFNF